ncbi:DUF2530 domain-containing protein [Luteococcus sp. H138]|uniref:DUF2530 domain-containing protein n=1 Tax=unclassified Luteococcus TaxID=2639923 RepID=UPI00313D2079
MTEPRGNEHHHFVQAPIRPLDEDGVTVAKIGTALWLVATLALWLRLDVLASNGQQWWLWVGVSGVLLGLVGIWWCSRRRRRRD